MNRITLNIDNKDVQFWFGLGFLGEMIERTGLTLNDIVDRMGSNPFKMIPLLMLESCKYASMRKGEDNSFDDFYFADWIDNNGGVQNEKVIKFMNKFNDSLTKDVPKDEVESEPKKK